MKVLAYLLGLALAPFVVFFLGAWLLALIARKYGGADPYAVSRGYTYRFTKQDDSLRVRSEKRRADAHAVRRDARRLETGDRDDRWPRLQSRGGRS